MRRHPHRRVTAVQRNADVGGADVRLLPAALQGRLVRLRPIARVDHPVLFTWRNDDRWAPPFARRCDRFTGGVLHPSQRIVDFDEWQRTELQYLLHSGVALFAEKSDGGAPVGVVHMDGFNSTDGRADYREFYPGEVFRTREAAESTALFLDHLFRRYPLRKLCAEVLAYDEGHVEKLQRAGFREEMRLKEDAWYGASYVDYVYLGLFGPEWLERRTAYLADLAISDLPMRP